MECGKIYSIEEYMQEMDEDMWKQLSCRPCDRV